MPYSSRHLNLSRNIFSRWMTRIGYKDVWSHDGRRRGERITTNNDEALIGNLFDGFGWLRTEEQLQKAHAL
jgi:hypothetical protein